MADETTPPEEGGAKPDAAVAVADQPAQPAPDTHPDSDAAAEPELPALAAGEVLFEPAPGVSRVLVNVQELDETLEVDGPTAVSHPAAVAALDRHPRVQRHEPQKRKRGSRR